MRGGNSIDGEGPSPRYAPKAGATDPPPKGGPIEITLTPVRYALGPSPKWGGLNLNLAYDKKATLMERNCTLITTCLLQYS